MEKLTYEILQTTPRLGKAGGTVKMTERQARYWVRAGVIAAKSATTGKSKSKKG